MVVRGNPGHPAEECEGFKEVVGEPEVDEHCSESPQEELVAAHAVEPLERTWHCDVVVIVECGVEGDGHQRVRPDAV